MLNKTTICFCPKTQEKQHLLKVRPYCNLKKSSQTNFGNQNTEEKRIVVNQAPIMAVNEVAVNECHIFIFCRNFANLCSFEGATNMFISFECGQLWNRMRTTLVPSKSCDSQLSNGAIFVFRRSIKIHFMATSKFAFHLPALNFHF